MNFSSLKEWLTKSSAQGMVDAWARGSGRRVSAATDPRDVVDAGTRGGSEVAEVGLEVASVVLGCEEWKKQIQGQQNDITRSNGLY